MAAFKSPIWAVTLLLMTAFVGCQTAESPASSEVEQQKPTPTGWLSELIRELEQEDVSNPPAKVYRYTYNGKEVYFLTSRCCDITSKVYDTDGNLLCEPDGGITGQGDGRCTDFFDARTNETLIWEDKREYN